MVLIAGLVSPVSGATTETTPSVTGVSLGGGSGTTTVGTTLHAKAGAQLTIEVTAENAACVVLSGAHSGLKEINKQNKASFTVTAAAGDGQRTVVAHAYPTFTKGIGQTADTCTGSQSAPFSKGYVADNTGPTVTAELTPSPTAAGWNRSNVAIRWAAADPAGVQTGPTPATDSVTSDTAGVTKTATATDRLGNTATGSVVVRKDGVAPSISANVAAPSGNNGWHTSAATITWTCNDQGTVASGIPADACPAPVTLTDGKAQSVTRSVADAAGNSASGTASSINVDTTRPRLTPSVPEPVWTSPGGARWWSGPVEVTWTAQDHDPGQTGCSQCSGPAEPRIFRNTVSGPGANLVDAAEFTDVAGNTARASATVNIDTAPPTTTVAPGTDWNRWFGDNVSVDLRPSDALSGVRTTHYLLDGQAGTGTTVSISGEGIHELEYWSVDNVGNEEAHKTLTVKVDRSSPWITSSISPAPNGAGWNNGPATVRFTCGDQNLASGEEGSGVESCTSDQAVSGETAGTTVNGTARDRAGNTASGFSTVKIDKTPPVLSVAPDREPNADGWYDAPVQLTWSTCSDTLSGIRCPALDALTTEGTHDPSLDASDVAGNTASARLTNPVRIDTTPPTISGHLNADPAHGGWYNADQVATLAVVWSCSDSTSGLRGGCPARTPLDQAEGEAVTATASAADRAGNQASNTVTVKIDKTAPLTSATIDDTPSFGWYTRDVTIRLSAVDHLSQVGSTFFKVGAEGEAQRYDADTGIELRGAGVRRIYFWSVDRAGNVEPHGPESPNSIEVKIDGIKPNISAERTPAANEHGWNDEEVNVSFTCSDEQSGLANPHCSSFDTVVGHGAGSGGTGVTVTGFAIDNAANVESASIDGIKVDLEAPTLTWELVGSDGAALTPTNGWYREPVTVRWLPSDTLSGIDPESAPNELTYGEDGTHATPRLKVADLAGNESQLVQVPVNVDATAPQMSAHAIPYGATDRSVEARPTNGWYTQDLLVDFRCADDTSGTEDYLCAADRTLTEDGTFTVTGTGRDHAGNEETVTREFKIDTTPPQTTARFTCGAAGAETRFCTGATSEVPIEITAEGSGGSGIEAIHHAVDFDVDGQCSEEFTRTPGGAATATIPIDQQSGTAELCYFATDVAGNRQSQPNIATIDFDNIAPLISARPQIEETGDPYTNSAWVNKDVIVHFDVSDERGGSGIDTRPDPVPVRSDTTDTLGADAGSEGGTKGRRVSATVRDRADNAASAATIVRVDKTPPSIDGTVDEVGPADGWFNGPVDVRFECSDSLSGVAATACPFVRQVADEGRNLSVTGSVTDAAGNRASDTVDGIKIDTTPPETTARYTAPPEVWTNGNVTVRLEATDALSGVARTLYRIDAGEPQLYSEEDGIVLDREGPVTLTYWSVDEAGNEEGSVSGLPGPASLTFLIDKTPPEVTGSAATESGRSLTGGWTNEPVAFAFTCTDPGGSGVAQRPTAPTLSEETAEPASVSGHCSDHAGNVGSATVGPIGIDLTPPTLTPTLDPTRLSAGGWYSSDVEVTWASDDALSRIDESTLDVPDVLSGEGTVTGEGSVSDRAGNETVVPLEVKIDKTDPELTGYLEGAAGERIYERDADDWFNATQLPVTVNFECTDPMPEGVDAVSGIAEGGCQKSVALASEGYDQTAAASAIDRAGNSGTGRFGGISIDGTAPQTVAELACGDDDDYCTGGSTQLRLTATDQSGLSGISAIHYVTSDGKGVLTGEALAVVEDDQHVSSGVVNVPLPANQASEANVTFWAVDVAGNKEPGQTVSLRYDNVAPVVTHVKRPAANAAGWNNTDTTVDFSATDEGSGVARQPDDVTVSAETNERRVTGEARDQAGNTGTDTAIVRLDKTPPSIQGAPARQPDANGWYSRPVTVGFTCSAGSGAALSGTCPTSYLTANGADQSVRGTIGDLADNSASATVSDIDIDSLKPSVRITGIENGGVYTLGGVPNVGCAAEDVGESGLAGNCTTRVTGGEANGVGTFTAVATATDRAGNTQSVEATYSVQYGFPGFTNPDTTAASTTSVTRSSTVRTYKAGSTIPVKFRLYNKEAQVIQAGATPLAVKPQPQGFIDASVTVGTFRWDAVDRHYIYNWNTDKLPIGFWTIAARLDDGQTHLVTVYLR